MTQHHPSRAPSSSPAAPPTDAESADIAVVGAGAAGLFAAIFAARTLRAADSPATVVALDGAKKLGAKILVAGGGRCNVTHHAVSPDAYAGSTRNAVKKVLKRFDVQRTRDFFAQLGVHLKREDTGKLFPVSDSARDVVDALLRAANDAHARIRHPWRVQSLEPIPDGRFRLTSDAGHHIFARRVVLATGGMSLPKTGSDGHGYALARTLGHTITEHVFPSLVPLKLDHDATFITSLSGIAADVEIEARSAAGKRLARFHNSMLCTHFGVSGPAALDVSRYFLLERTQQGDARLVVNWLPGASFDSLDHDLQQLGAKSVLNFLRERLPDRLARALIEHADIPNHTRGADLTRDQRRNLVHTLTQHTLPVTGDRGFLFAEVTAGGVPLEQLDLKSMASRRNPNAHLCGEICDVDGRIGGFNFQWAWASGFVAGTAAAKALLDADQQHDDPSHLASATQRP